MPSVDLTDQEWQQVITLLANKCIWAEVNMLLVKMTQQLEGTARRVNGPIQQDIEKRAQ